ncbi:hypothetical protein K438DRAFT_1967799 [Mycena galopus ATCC 62051]|nr:hypothetical protein K438DRAFT_1967799 [Mycena galopus ATCC 62051]
MTTSYSTFYKSGLHAHAASVYTYNHPHDEDMEHENASHLSTGDLVYFAAGSTYHNDPHHASRAQSPRSPSRKRRSSITSMASPISSVKLAKSPARAAGNAWHIAHVAATSPRSRSGSLVQNVACEDNSMLGRIRSGSIGTRLRGRKPLTNRRPIALLFAPTPPPPTAPLPALPLCAPARAPLTRLAIQPALPVADVFYTRSPVSPSPLPLSPSAEFHHPPGFGPIDEEMKEN